MGKSERTVDELYADDPERADAIVFGRRTNISRRGFLNGAGLVAMTTAVGAPIVFASNMPGGLIPAALAQTAGGEAPATGSLARGPGKLDLPGKDAGLVVLADRPLVAETPEHLLDDETTPRSKFYVNNHGQPPRQPPDGDSWRLSVDGEVTRPIEMALAELKTRFRAKTLRMVLEAGGNGRSFFVPQTLGPQWTNGGVGCPEWTGVPLADVLRSAGVKSSAVYTAHYGADEPIPAGSNAAAFSRGVPMKKAMEEHCLLAWAMNGQPLDNVHGAPLRLIIPGWPGSASHKWLSRITLRDVVHDSRDMTGTSYRVTIKPMLPGAKADPANFKIMEAMPARSIITNPANGTRFRAGTKELRLRGAAWAGDPEVRAVHVSMDYGATWQLASMAPPKNRYDWRRWSATTAVPADGFYEIWVRATDASNRAQPHVAGNWNPQGYAANPMHRIAVLIG